MADASSPSGLPNLRNHPLGVDGRALGLPLEPQLEPAGWSTSVAFPQLVFDDPVNLEAAPRSNYLFVSEREGKLYAFQNDPATSEKILVLDLSDVNQGEDDSGPLGFVFHPEFGDDSSENADYVYVHYAYTDNPIVGSKPDSNTPTYSRLARFSIDRETMTADPASELVLIDQYDQSVWHQGGAMFFHPDDGFLYLAVGDEGSASCQLDNCQQINKDLFSGVLRLDVDMRGGDISQPIARQPQTGTTANYFIPSDNPFVGDAGVLQEFYAIGLRSPHRMTLDPVDGVVFIGDVGQNDREELNVLKRGANYQWNLFEGQLQLEPAPADVIGEWTGPLLDFTRDEFRSIIGGYVYRGERFAELRGKYVFGDFSTGGIYALEYEIEAGDVVSQGYEKLLSSPFLDRVNGITSFGVDHRGELYILTLGDEAQIHRLERVVQSTTNLPQKLSDTNVFASTEDFEPGETLLPFRVNSPLWSDGAHKSRWVSLPEAGQVTFSEADSWRFPQGTVFVKHFEMALDERRLDERRKLETRLLVAGAQGRYYGASYKWNEQGTDAELLLVGEFEELSIINEDGEQRTLNYYYPGPSDCLVCHNEPAGNVLGLNTAQLNRDIAYAQDSEPFNQLDAWVSLGRFREGSTLDGRDSSEYPRLASLDDDDSSIEHRIRSYWSSNCSMCHGALPGIKSRWDARYATPLADQGVINGALVSNRNSDDRVIVPGDLSRSVLYQRDISLDPTWRMPPLGRSSVDTRYIELLEEFILSLAAEQSPEDAGK